MEGRVKVEMKEALGVEDMNQEVTTKQGQAEYRNLRQGRRGLGDVRA